MLLILSISQPLAKVGLKTYVDDKGLVDYEALQANRQDLDAFNASIQIADPASYERWSESDQIAFFDSTPTIH